MAATVPLREALNKGISTGGFVDTKLILYSHRDSSRRVCRPKALYANSHVLQKVAYFDTVFETFKEPRSVVLRMLHWALAESKLKGLGDGIDEEEFADDYGYLSDSDLEDDEDEEDAYKYTNRSNIYPYDPFLSPGADKVVHERHDELARKGRVIKIPDMAFVT